jgi:DNA-binding transcriptional ArsR family regulator
MRTARPPLLPIFRSRLQGELLAAVLLNDEERSVTQLAEALQASVATVHREITSLAEAGILTSRRVGNVRLVRAERANPVNEPLTRLVLLTFGPLKMIG